MVGQGGEFDYSGTQALKALKSVGIRVILVNPNPATIMTDYELADATYLEPINVEAVTKIIDKEKPDAILPIVGGQTALNCSINLAKSGILSKYNVEMLGVTEQAIKKSEDRQLFSKTVEEIGLKCPENIIISSIEETSKALDKVGLPAIIRPSFTLGGLGGGIAKTEKEFVKIVSEGLAISPIKKVEINKSVIGWKEYEFEVMKDIKGNGIVVCAIENLDPMGVHTGDSITIAPTITLRDEEFQRMRDASLAILNAVGLKAGGANVQFAVHNDKMLVIEMNPRVSRSSALASKATGYPIAKIAAKLALGFNLDEIKNDCANKITASFEPSFDYIITKVPRFNFNKFNIKKPKLTSSMQSVGEVMSIGRNFQESIQKAFCSLEEGFDGIQETDTPISEILQKLETTSPKRILYVADALRYGFTIDEIHKITFYDKWFLHLIQDIIVQEMQLEERGLPKTPYELLQLKKMGFSDSRIAKLCNADARAVRQIRKQFQVLPVFKRIDTCAAEFPTSAAYLYECYEGDSINMPNCESGVTSKKKVIVIGSGPNRIGQGIEFDWACVHALKTIQEEGLESIMINCNPETVSTDYDVSDKLYFSPLDHERVLNIIEKENSTDKLEGVIVQLGGQTPLNLSRRLDELNVKILGTQYESMDIAEDRDRFNELIKSLEIKQPKNNVFHDINNLRSINPNTFPILVRPSYVLGGMNMAIIHNQQELENYITNIKISSGPILVDEYLTDALEVDVDSVCDGKNIYIAGITEHIEEAGIHSGDSISVIPTQNINKETIEAIKSYTKRISLALKIVGLINIQFAIKDEDVYVLEVNPRASRTVPFISKATGVPIANLATKVILGKKLTQFNLSDYEKNLKNVSVKCPVFSFASFADVDTILGPEMKSTGEVMATDIDFPRAFAKAQLASNNGIPKKNGLVVISVKNRDKNKILPIAQRLLSMGFKIISTKGTGAYLNKHGIKTYVMNKVWEGQPHIVDYILNNDVTLVINTTEGVKSIHDSASIRRASLMKKIPCCLTISVAIAMLDGIEAVSDINIMQLEKTIKI